MRIRINKAQLIKTARATLGITVGAVLMALSLVLFLIPHRLAAGGVSGLAVILFYLFELPVGVSILVLNLPLFIIAFFSLGPQVVVRSLVGTVIFSAAAELLTAYLPLMATQDILLAAVYGGILMGIGTGMVFRFRGSTGGTSLVSLLLNRVIGLSTGQGLLYCDLVIIALGLFVFGGEVAMYAALSLFVSSYVIDMVQEGLGLAKAVLIITSQGQVISERLLKELNRGVTKLPGEGAYTGEPRELLLCVVNRLQVAQLKGIIQESDPRAFFIIGSANEVHGEGFRRLTP
ncbi:MAG TPA: YitT family protein [Firmicutes bacterium]|nr:YitT family protein [Bacillota bacterium]